MRLVHLSFANDLLIFSGSQLESVQAINNILMHFSAISGMKINEGKSSVFFSGTNDEVKRQMLNLLRFREGKLPIKYLGVPLLSTRLKKEHCSILLNKISARINS